MPNAVIVAAARSPIGRAHKGSLRDMRPDELGAGMVEAALAQVPELDPAQIDDLMVGCAQPAGEQGYNLGRMIALRLGLDGVPGTTVQRYCASSLQTTRMAAHAIRCGEGELFVAAGVEMVSRYALGKADGMPETRNPRYEEAAHRTAIRAKDAAVEWMDPRCAGELPDVYIGMGETAENVAQLCDVSRAEQDEWAVRSHQRAEAAAERGFWATDITSVTLPDGTVVAKDDGPRSGVTREKVAELKPVFRDHGTVTAANCCPLNDGAAALVVTSDRLAGDQGLSPMARVVSTGVSALSPEIMGLGPVA
ncbi:MAG: acetyl-CoA C-acyltransferase, partial [Actinomycetota bacterium]|nr:acetyl-CoA C-acyltransferase [Actinomycetota bacterium]